MRASIPVGACPTSSPSRCASIGPSHRPRRSTGRVESLLGQVGLAAADGDQVPAPVLRWPAAAAVDRAGPVDPARLPRLRRADVGARRLGPGPGAEPDARPAAPVRPHLPVHLAQPGRRPSHRRPGRRHVPRADRRDCDVKQVFGRPRHPYTRMLLDTIPDLADRSKADAGRRGSAQPDPPAAGLRVPPRCPFANDRCRMERPAPRSAGPGILVACHAVEEGRLPPDERPPAAAPDTTSAPARG